MAHRANKRPPGRIKSSIVARLNTRLFFRLLGIYFTMDLLLLILFCGGLFVWSEQQAAQISTLVEERGVPSAEATEWMTAGDYTVTAGTPEADGLRLPGWLPSPEETRGGVRYFNPGTVDLLLLVTFSSGDATSYTLQMPGDEPYAIRLDLTQPAAIFVFAARVLFICQLASLVTNLFKNAGSIKKVLRPIQELAATAAKLNQVERMSPEELKALAGKLDEINATHLDRRIDLPGTQKELKTLAQAINAMLDRINEAYRSQMRFVSDASHELRTPLAAIHGYAELYKMQRDMPGALERADESIEHIERSSQRMTVLVEDLLSLARLDEGRGIDMTGTVKLSSLVTDAVDDLHALDPDRAVRRMQISLEPARDLNHPAEFSLAEGDWPEVVLPGDASRLRQVVTNIVGNIHRYTPADSPAEAALGVMPAAIDPRQLARMPASDASMRRFIDAAEVGASMQTGYRYAVLRFVDHGPGVPPESRSKIFERFYTADPSRAREKGGTGLGMAIAQSVVKAHHGFICATGTDGGGLTFTVVLPIEQIAAPEPKQSTGKTKDAKQKTSWFSSERKTQATQPKA